MKPPLFLYTVYCDPLISDFGVDQELKPHFPILHQ
jgi:hypothetical protein